MALRLHGAGLGDSLPFHLKREMPSDVLIFLFLCLRLNFGSPLPGARGKTHFSPPFFIFFYLSNLASLLVD